MQHDPFIVLYAFVLLVKQQACMTEDGRRTGMHTAMAEQADEEGNQQQKRGPTPIIMYPSRMSVCNVHNMDPICMPPGDSLFMCVCVGL